MVESPETDPVTRIRAADAAAILERLSGTDRLERGSVFVLSVEAIRDRALARWSKRRDDVWGYLDRKLEEHLSYQDLHQRISDTDCLVAMTSEDGVAAQAVGLKVLEEVLLHFLGVADPIDIRIKSVGRIDGDELTCTDLDPARLATARSALSAEPFKRQVAAEVERERNPISFVAATGLRMKIDYALEQVVSLRHGVTAVLRVEPTVTFAATGEVIPPRKFSRLADEDIAVIDRATLSFAALFTPEDARTQPPVIVPASFRTMAGRRGRQALAVIEGMTPERVRQGMMLELVDIDRGTPTGRLIEATGYLGQLTRGVLARVHPARDAIEPVRGVRLNGLTMDFQEIGLEDDHLGQLMRMMALQLRGKTPALIALGLHASHQQLAEVAGFSHGATRGRPMTSESRNVA
jgi:hypothetical protein